jgi:Cu-processing system ATP-binding protein
MIEITGLTKRFGALQVLRSINLTIRPGRVTALIGPNGAGKTTLIKSILGLTRADSGEIYVGAMRVSDDPSYRTRIGYMPQIARFPDNLTAAELIAMVTDLRQRDDPRNEPHDDELIERLQLSTQLNKPLRVLSGGTRQKVNAVLAFLFRPSLVVLDEPSAGLDPVASSVLKDKVLSERANGCTVLLTSHIMSEVDELADDIVFLLDGAVSYTGTIHNLKTDTQQQSLERAIAQMMYLGAA